MIEPGREGVSAHGSTVNHGGHNLDAFQPHPLQVGVVEATVGQQLETHQQLDRMMGTSKAGTALKSQKSQQSLLQTSNGSLKHSKNLTGPKKNQRDMKSFSRLKI